ncbi:transient receptor potential cation channel subfamily V member 4-like [Haliotis cracherodii]|uniref:transient receptor potential cation channel subfamily V member 4-like n=1 Tax=Haliotis cracherodii TaxID=6455 RepID=UPI0039EB394B
MHERFEWEKADRIGRRMNGTVFMAQLPFHTAVLCYLNDPTKDDTCWDPENRFVKIIQLFVEKNDVFEKKNYRGDTVLHSIMRFVRCFPSLERRTVDMMSWLESLMDKRAMKAGEDVIDYKRKLFFTKNKTHMTALQLATESGHINLFAYFMKVKGVYLIEYPHDNIYEIQRCDVTEMDKIALITAQRYQTQTDKNGHLKETHAARKNDQTTPVSNLRNQSVAELLCCQNLPVATELVRADVFEEMVRRKLNTYCVPFWILSVFHVSLICLLCVYVVARAGAIEGISWPPRVFLELCNIVTFLCSILYFVQEFPLRYCFAKQPFALTAVHHNVVYRVLFVLFAVCLFADSILYRIPNSVFVDYKTTFLILAIVVGTWLILFFLRRSRRFSLYIVLLNEALFKTVVPFAVLILMQVLVFSACMHATFLHNEQNSSVLEEFSQYGMSLLTMGKLMIGLTEIDQLLKSREDGIIVFLFSVFILITFLLMINALIGVMTNRFHDTQTNTEMVWRLQKLSIIIFIEGWFCVWTSKRKFESLGDPENYTDEAFPSNIDGYTTKRFVMSYRRVLSATADNPGNAEHILRKQVKRSEELNVKMDRLLDLQESKSYDGTRALQIYHYKY